MYKNQSDADKITADFVFIFITVRHGSADTVVRAMNVFNGKRCFWGV